MSTLVSTALNFSLVVPAIDDTVCGKPPVIPNGKLTGGHTVYVADSTVTVNCEEGFLAQVQNFICLNGEWNSRGTPLPDVCKSESLVSQLSATRTNGLPGSRPHVCFLSPCS